MTDTKRAAKQANFIDQMAPETRFERLDDETPANRLRLACAIIRARRTREQLFGEELFADPAWDILLGLYVDELRQVRSTVTKVCEAAAAPATTALRWIEKLEASGWLTRQSDTLDGRRLFVRLSGKGLAEMERYFVMISGENPDSQALQVLH